MGMSVGGKKGGPSSDINMTPMIDILLVLLIIFMVVQQSLQKGVSVQVPPVKQEDQPQDPNQNPDQIVLEIKPGHVYEVNRQPVAREQLKQFLTDLYAPRPRKVIFVKGDEDVSYGDVVFVVDTCRASGIEIVGLVPRPDATPIPGA